MPFDAKERTVAMYEQASLDDVPADWDADADVREFLCIEPDVEGVGRAVNPNQNYVRRAYATRPSLLALRNGTFKFGVYLTGNGATTANAAQAATFALAELLRNAWGGMERGYAAAAATPSTTAPIVTATQGANFADGQWIFGVHAATGRGQFALINEVSTDTLNLRTTLDAVADTCGAVIQCFPNTRALTQRQHAEAVTHAFFVRGEGSDDNFELIGCKLTLSALDALEAGQEPICRFDGMCTDFRKEGVTQPDLDGTPDGPAPITVGTGANSTVRMANLGTAAIADIEAFGVALTPGITQNPVPGWGLEGRLGYHGGGNNETVLEVTVPYDESWIADFENRQEKHVLVQIGHQRGTAVGIYLPRCVIDEDPRRGSTAEETSMVLKLRALEYNGATSLTGDDLERWAAKVQILLAA